MARIFVTGGTEAYRDFYTEAFAERTGIWPVLHTSQLQELGTAACSQSWIAEGVAPWRFRERNLQRLIVSTADIILELPSAQADFVDETCPDARIFVEHLKSVGQLRRRAQHEAVSYRIFSTNEQATDYLYLFKPLTETLIEKPPGGGLQV